jgi:hypothetical protein
MNKVETTKEITDFINFNSVDIAQLKNDNADIYNAFSGLLLAIDKQYGSGDLKADAFNVAPPKASTFASANYDAQINDFINSGKKIDFLPKPIKDLALDNQKNEGNTPNANLNLGVTAQNFSWRMSPQGFDFWESILDGDWDIYFNEPDKWENPKAPATKLATKPATSTASTSSAPLSNWKPTWKVDGKSPSPTRSASAGTDGEYGIGNDGFWYEIRKNKAGIQQWKKTALTFKNIINRFKNISNEDLNVYADQLRYAMVSMDKGDDIYKDLINDLKTAKALTKV